MTGKTAIFFGVTWRFLCVSFVVCCGLIIFFGIQISQAQFTQTINYQGKLTGTSSVAVSNGSYAMTFRLYNVVTGGSPIYTEARTATTTSGLFSIMIGEVSSLSSVNFNQPLYLSVSVGGDAEMSPRKSLGAVPAAFEAKNSQTVGGVASTSLLRTDLAGSVTASSSGSLFTLIQNGSGKILSLFDAAVEVLTVAKGGNVGIGTTTPNSKFSVAGAGFFNGNLTTTGTLTAAGTTTLSTTTVTTLNLTNALSLNSGGTGFSTYATGDIVYASGANTLAKRTVGNNGDIFSVVGGVPTWNSTTTLGLLTTTAIDTSAKLLAILGDETGTGLAVFATAPALTTPIIAGATLSGTISNGTFSGGTWQGTAVADTYVSDILTLGAGSTINGTTIGASTSSTAVFTNATSTNASITNLTVTGLFRDTTLTPGTVGQILLSTGTSTRWTATSSLGLAGGSVTSVALSAPTGFSVSGSPVTTSGTLTLSYTAGYEGLLSASSTNWNGFYNSPSSRITAGTGLSWTSNTLNVGTSTLGIALVDTTGILASTRGGTGTSTITQNQLLIGGAGNTWSQIATSSLGLQSQNAILTDISDGTIATDLVNTANPWVDNEVVDALTITGGTINNTPIGASTPSTGVFTNATTTNLNVTNTITGSISGNAGTVTTNANLTGAITSTGNVTVLGSFSSASLFTALTTKTGNTSNVVFSDSPTFTGTVAIGGTLNATSLNATTTNASTSNITNAVIGSATSTNQSITNLTVTGLLRDTTLSAGTLGMVLQTTGTSSRWVATSTLGLTSTGVTLTGENYLSLAGQQITANAINLSGTNVTGALAAGRFPALTGDITTVAGALGTILATVNSNVGSFGSSTAIPTFTVNAKGLITAAGTAVVVAPAGTLTGTTLAAGVTGSSLTSVGTLANLTVSGLSTLGLMTATNATTTNLNVTNTITGSISGNAGTVTTNANLTGAITSAGNATLLGSFSSASLFTALTTKTGNTSNVVFSDSPTFTTQISTPVVTNAGTLALSATGANIITASTNGSERLRIDSAGNVGIGTTTPNSKLTVQGDINISDTTQSYKLGGIQILYASTTNLSTAVGLRAGNALNSGGLQNTAVGYEALLVATSSDFNTAVGYQALGANTTGQYNTALGHQALKDNITGSSNVVFGALAGTNNTNQSANVIIGASAGQGMASGVSANTIIGFLSGSNLAGSNNTVIGANATLSGIGLPDDNNNILITDGSGNRRIFVNSSGNMGVGTTTPTSVLTVAGSIGSEATSTTGLSARSNATLGLSSGGGLALTTLQHPTAAGQRLGLLFFGSNNNTTAYNSVGISGWSNEAFTSASNNGGYLVFETKPNASAGGRLERMRIDSDGNVSIGTTTSPTPLYVNIKGNLVNPSSLLSGSIAFGNFSSISSTSPAIFGKSNDAIGLRVVALTNDTNTLGDLNFDVREQTTGPFTTLTNPGFTFTRNGTRLITVTRDGNFGIGASTPSSKLTVVDDTTGTSGTQYLTRVSGSQSVAHTGAIYGIETAPLFTAGAGNTMATLVGVRGIPINNSTGTVTTLSGLQGQPQNSSSGLVTGMRGVYAIPQNTGLGTTTNMTGVYSNPSATLGGVTNMYSLYADCGSDGALVTNCYGLYIPTVTETGVVTNEYGVYQADTDSINYFGGTTGMGTTTPGQRLSVVDAQATGYVARITNTNTTNTADGLLISLGVANASRGTGNYFVGFSTLDGTVAGKIQGGASAVVYTTTAADLAEYFPVADERIMPVPGEIVALDPENAGGVMRATAGLTPFGIIATNPGFLGNGPICKAKDTNCDANYAKDNAIVSLSGQVPLRVNLEGGPIAIGDEITLSSVSGVGKKASEIGDTVVGIALGDYRSKTTSNTIRVFVTNKRHLSLADQIQQKLFNVDLAASSTVFTTLLHDSKDTIWHRLVTLASGFTDGVLTATGFKAQKLETEELCIGTTCYSADEFHRRFDSFEELKNQNTELRQRIETLEGKQTDSTPPPNTTNNTGTGSSNESTSTDTANTTPSTTTTDSETPQSSSNTTPPSTNPDSSTTPAP